MKTIKEKIKAKAKATKEKVKGKLKGSKKVKAVAVIAVAALALAGCLDTAPTSRGTSATYGDIIVKIGDSAKNNSVSVKLGDGALASADSKGSTETQTITPTLDIRPDIDVRYNDAIAGATAASKSVLGSIGDGLTAVLDLMQSKKSGTVAVTTKDGTAATVKCEDGQCSYCEDCQP